MKTPNCHPDRKWYCKDLCRSCYEKQLRASNPEYAERQRENCRGWTSVNKDRKREVDARYKANMPKVNRTHRVYGLTREQYDEIMARPCGICGDPSVHMDHDHSHCPRGKGCSKCIRGGLCHRCNLGLGYYEGWLQQHKEAIERWLSKGDSDQNSSFGHRDESESSAPLESVRDGYDEFGPARGFKPDDLLGSEVVSESGDDLPKDNGWALCTDLTCFCRSR